MLDSETEICWIQKEWKKIHCGKIIEKAAMLCQYQMTRARNVASERSFHIDKDNFLKRT